MHRTLNEEAKRGETFSDQVEPSTTPLLLLI